MSTPQYIETAPDQLNAQHLGMRAFFQWEDPNMYKIGTIVGDWVGRTARCPLGGSFSVRPPAEPDWPVSEHPALQ